MTTDVYRNQSLWDDVPAEWRVGDAILDLYEVTRVLGEGGMGKVYLVRRKGTSSFLAVKSPRPQIVAGPGGVESFVREAETWLKLGEYPHIVFCVVVWSLGHIPHIPHIEFVNRTEFPPHGGGRSQVLAT